MAYKDCNKFFIYQLLFNHEFFKYKLHGFLHQLIFSILFGPILDISFSRIVLFHTFTIKHESRSPYDCRT